VGLLDAVELLDELDEPEPESEDELFEPLSPDDDDELDDDDPELPPGLPDDRESVR
jgi:hypothetical protein